MQRVYFYVRSWVSLVESDGPPYCSLDARETGESATCSWAVAVGLTGCGWRGGKISNATLRYHGSDLTIIVYGIHNLSRTDVECEWKKQKAPEQVKPVEELYPCSRPERDSLKRELNSDDRSWFYQELKKYGNFTAYKETIIFIVWSEILYFFVNYITHTGVLS